MSDYKESKDNPLHKEFGIWSNTKYIIKNIAKQYPNLPPKDLNGIGLMCCGFNDAEIAVCKGYRNEKSVKASRNKIRNKMHLDILLQEYLNDRMK